MLGMASWLRRWECRGGCGCWIFLLPVFTDLNVEEVVAPLGQVVFMVVPGRFLVEWLVGISGLFDGTYHWCFIPMVAIGMVQFSPLMYQYLTVVKS